MYESLNQSKAFQEYLERLRDKRAEAFEMCKSGDGVPLYRAQGEVLFADWALDLVDQMILEAKEEEE